jgi:hypothetical protein
MTTEQQRRKWGDVIQHKLDAAVKEIVQEVNSEAACDGLAFDVTVTGEASIRRVAPKPHAVMEFAEDEAIRAHSMGVQLI